MTDTCCICLSKIKYTLKTEFKKKKLLCDHVFHSSCINSIYKMVCPLCQCPIFNEDETLLLKSNKTIEMLNILKNIQKYKIDIVNVFMFINTNKKYDELKDLFFKYCDFTDVLVSNLDNLILAKTIITKGRVNWFKTFYGGMTFLDLVNASSEKINPEIIKLISEKFPSAKNTGSSSIEDAEVITKSGNQYECIYPSLNNRDLDITHDAYSPSAPEKGF